MSTTVTGALSRSVRENARPFFSRRIGLSDSGEPVGLDVGARLAGRIGRWNLGFLGIRQEGYQEPGDPVGIDATDMFVGRLTANLLEESSAGIIVTSGDPRSNLDNMLVGADFTYRNSRLAGGKRLEANAWYQLSDTEGVDGSDVAYTHRLKDHLIENITAGVDSKRVDYIDGELQSQLVIIDALRLENQIGDEVGIAHNLREENLLRDFEISDGIIIPAGRYGFSDTSVSFGTSDARPWDVEVEIRTGELYTGDIMSYEVSAGWRPSRHFTGSLSYEVDRVDLPQGKFDNQVSSANLGITFSNTLSWVNLIQFDNVSNDLGIDSRFHWTPEAGRNFFIVLSHNMNRSDIDDRFSTTRTGLAIKLDHTFRF